MADQPSQDDPLRARPGDRLRLSAEEELLLPRGDTIGVTRIGPTVRRPVGHWTPGVHDLLRHLEASGFVESPRVLGVDEYGREILSFIEGETTAQHPWPGWVWADDTLTQAGRLLRRYHRAVATFSGAGRAWMARPAGVSPHQVVCHNDFTPYNVVYRDGGIVGMIDWDWAGPAAPEWDLAMTAYAWVPLFDPLLASRLEPPPPSNRETRLRLLLDSYGLANREGFVGLVAERVQASVDGITALADRGWGQYVALVETGHVKAMTDAVAYLRREGMALEAAVLRSGPGSFSSGDEVANRARLRYSQ
jgi:Phosphotransferase enzyme family